MDDIRRGGSYSRVYALQTTVHGSTVPKGTSKSETADRVHAVRVIPKIKVAYYGKATVSFK